MGVFDKWTKKATNTAVETAKETLNDKLNTYSGIIKVFLTLSVIAFGSKKVNDHVGKKPEQQTYQQPPIIINNYYDRGYVPHGKQKVRNSGKH